MNVVKVPDASLLSKARLALDMAYAAYWQKEHAGKNFDGVGAMYLLCDSSPQCGFDWLLLEVWVLYGGDEELATLFTSICTLSCGLTDGAAKETLVKSIEQRFKRHVSPPTVLGSKRAQLSHKLHALLHSLFLENFTWTNVWRMLQRTVSLTTDLGTESGLATVTTRQEGLQTCIPKLGDWSQALDILQGCEAAIAQDTRVAPLLCPVVPDGPDMAEDTVEPDIQPGREGPTATIPETCSSPPTMPAHLISTGVDPEIAALDC